MSEVNQEYHVDTDEVLKELQAEGYEMPGQEPAEQPQEEVAPSQQEPEEQEQHEEVAETETRVIDRAPKEPTLIPAWKAKITEERLAKENETLRQQIEALQRNPTQENRQEVQQSIADIRQLAQEEGLELDERQERFFNKLYGELTKNAVPQDLIKNVEAFQQHQQIAQLEQEYNNEFSNDVLPLIKEQYGELPEKELATLRQKLHDTAFTEAYAKVPLKEIFIMKSRELNIKTPKETIVTHKSGRTRNADIDLSNVDEATFATLDGEALDAFLEKKAARGDGWSRR